MKLLLECKSTNWITSYRSWLPWTRSQLHSEKEALPSIESVDITINRTAENVWRILKPRHFQKIFSVHSLNSCVLQRTLDTLMQISGRINTETASSFIYSSLHVYITKSRDSVVGIATDYGVDDQGVGVRVPVRARIFTSPRRPDRFWCPPSFLSNGYLELFPRG
jgi:hypothetical protein